MSADGDERRLRPLVEADLDSAMRIERQRAGTPWTRDQLRSELHRSAWALDVDGRLTGYACLSLVPPEAELLTIVIDAAARRRGHGGWLFDRVVRHALESGCHEMRLEVRPSNVPALALYRQRGFVEVGRRTGYYTALGEDALLLRASLVEPGD